MQLRAVARCLLSRLVLLSTELLASEAGHFTTHSSVASAAVFARHVCFAAQAGS
jgi:hypothetical protein